MHYSLDITFPVVMNGYIDDKPLGKLTYKALHRRCE